METTLKKRAFSGYQLKCSQTTFSTANYVVS
jgi:hypothetical protein